MRRSAELLDYGPQFHYREVSAFGNPLMATAVTAGLGALAGGLSFGPTRKLLDRVLPDPGEGPSEKSRESGYFRIEVHGDGRAREGRRQGRPGLRGDRADDGRGRALPRAQTSRSGVLTPAAAMGSALVERLRAAGMTLTVE